MHLLSGKLFHSSTNVRRHVFRWRWKSEHWLALEAGRVRRSSRVIGRSMERGGSGLR